MKKKNKLDGWTWPDSIIHKATVTSKVEKALRDAKSQQNRNSATDPERLVGREGGQYAPRLAFNF